MSDETEVIPDPDKLADEGVGLGSLQEWPIAYIPLISVKGPIKLLLPIVQP